MNLSLLALAIVTTAALFTVQEEQIEVIPRAEAEWSGSGPVLDHHWHTGVDSFLVLYSAIRTDLSDIRYFRAPPEDTIYRGQVSLNMRFDKLAGGKFSHDGSRVLIWGTTITNIGVFDVGTWDLVYQTNLDSLNTTLGRVFYAAISPTGDTLWVPDREGIAGIKVETGEKFVIDIKPDSVGYLIRSTSPDGRYLNGVATKVLSGTPTSELPDNFRHFIHDLKTGETVFSIFENDTVRDNGVSLAPIHFAPEPGFYYTYQLTPDRRSVVRKHTLPDRKRVAEFPVKLGVRTIDFSPSGEWMIIGSGTPIIGYDASIYHRDPYYLAGHLSDSSSNFHVGARLGMFSPDDQWIAGFGEVGQLFFFVMVKQTVSVAEGIVAGAGSSAVQLLPNVIPGGSDITFRSNWSGLADVLIVDVVGRVVATDEVAVESGVPVVMELRGRRLAPGQYFVVVRNEKFASAPLSLIVR